MKNFILFLFLVVFNACHKEPKPEAFNVPFDITGTWKTESIQNPGWIYDFYQSGMFCQYVMADTIWGDCSFNWHQSNDSVWINGYFNRLWRVNIEDDTTIVVWSFDGHGNPNNNMRLIRE